MNASRLNVASHWRNVGAGAARKGLPLEAVLTKSEGVNKHIREGFEAVAQASAKRGQAHAD